MGEMGGVHMGEMGGVHMGEMGGVHMGEMGGVHTGGVGGVHMGGRGACIYMQSLYATSAKLGASQNNDYSLIVLTKMYNVCTHSTIVVIHYSNI